MSDQDSFEELDPRVRQAVEGLIYLGHLTTEVEFCGHTFGLRTLHTDEEIAAGEVIESLRNTIKEPEAYVSAQIALALTHVDGDEEFCPPVGPDKSQYAKARYRYVTSQWYWPTIQYLYTEYTKLLGRQIEAIRSIQDLSSRSRPTFSPSPDFSTELGTSNDEMLTERPPVPS